MDQGAGAKAALPLLIFARQNVTGESSASLYFAGSSFTETLGGSPVGFDLGHFKLRYISYYLTADSSDIRRC